MKNKKCNECNELGNLVCDHIDNELSGGVVYEGTVEALLPAKPYHNMPSPSVSTALTPMGENQYEYQNEALKSLDKYVNIRLFMAVVLAGIVSAWIVKKTKLDYRS